MRVSSTFASPVVFTGVLASAALAQEAPEFTFMEVAADCSFAGIDHFFPAPEAEGNGLLSTIESYEMFDGAPYHFSMLGIYSCDTTDNFGAYWNKTETAGKILAELRDGPAEYSIWAGRLEKSEAAGYVGALGNGQAECACLLHYGIEVSQ